MLRRYELTNQEWEQIAPLLPPNLKELPSLSDQQIYKKSLTLKGVGNWTIKMYLIFELDRQDILPTEDIAFIQSYEWMYKTTDRSKESIEKRCKNGNQILPLQHGIYTMHWTLVSQKKNFIYLNNRRYILLWQTLKHI